MITRILSTLIFGIALLTLGALEAAPAFANMTDQFQNPAKPNKSADPSIFRDTDGTYYFMTTAGNISLWKSKSLSDIAAGTRQVVWNLPSSGPNSMSPWAPELHKIDGKWYIYYTATSPDPNNPSQPDPEMRRVFVIENDNEDPTTGTWTDRGQVQYPGIDFKSIDGTVIQNNGDLFIAWAGKNYQNTDGMSRLYIAELSNPWTMSTPPTKISEPTYAWEEVGSGVNEAPQFLQRNGKVFLTYSASGCWTDDYKLGMLTASASANLLNPASWTKTSTPVFQKSTANGVYGPGHNSFTKSPDDTEDYLIYHANPASGLGCGGDRQLKIQKFTWNTDGTPNFGTPVANSTSLDVPSGEPLKKRKEAEDAALSGAQTLTTGVSHYTGTGVVNLNTVSDSVTWSENMGVAGAYTFDFRYARGASNPAVMKLVVNGTVIDSSLDFPSTDSSGNWSEYGIVRARANLISGSNTIQLISQDNNQIYMDSLTIYGKSYEDNFDDGNANGWTTYSGTWSVNSGHEYQVSAGKGDKSIADNVSYIDFTYDADVTVTTGGRNAGLLFRASNLGVGRWAQTGYLANIVPDADQVVLVKFDGTSFTNLDVESLAMNTGQKYHVKVITDGSNIRILVDGELIINYNDSTYTQGSVGVRAVDSDETGITATFDNLEMMRFR
jgi:GH43 family beta-xylosidase